MECVLCSDELNPVLADGMLWRLVLNRNQNLAGKCTLVVRRHVEAVDQLTAAEWGDLRHELGWATAALRQATQPDHFNYAFLQNKDRHVHLHIIPRYATQREIAGLCIDDPDYPGHYAVPAPERRLTRDQGERVVALLRTALVRCGRDE
jgi:diadenosine tetraphosphate (Ap4A) HIT family hydrolase